MQSKQVLYNLFLAVGGVFLTVFIQFSELMNAWGTSKVLYVIGLSSVIGLVLAVMVMIRRQDIWLELNLLDLFVFLFVGYIFGRLLFTKYSSAVNSYFVVLVALTGIYFLLKELLRRVFSAQQFSMIYLLIGCLLLAGLIQAGYGLLQLYGLLPSRNQYFSVTGSFVNPDGIWLSFMQI